MVTSISGSASAARAPSASASAARRATWPVAVGRQRTEKLPSEALGTVPTSVHSPSSKRCWTATGRPASSGATAPLRVVVWRTTAPGGGSSAGWPGLAANGGGGGWPWRAAPDGAAVPPAESPLATVLGTAAKAADDKNAAISAMRRRNVRRLLDLSLLSMRLRGELTGSRSRATGHAAGFAPADPNGPHRFPRPPRAGRTTVRRRAAL